MTLNTIEKLKNRTGIKAYFYKLYKEKKEE